jgi:non-heme chloroperoxidase
VPEVTTNDGIRLHYEDAGEGTPVLLVPGWSMSGRWWIRQSMVLARDYRVITLDPRAQGGSENTQRGHRISRHAGDLHDVVEALDLHNLTIVGWSMACSSILSYWDIFRPSQVAKLALCCFTPTLLPRPGWKWGFDGDASRFISDVGMNHRQVTTDLIPAFFHDQSVLTSDELSWMVESTLETPAYAAEGVLWEQFHQDWRDVLPTINVPALFVAGRHDPQAAWQAVEYAANAAQNGRFEIFERSAHVPFYEESERFNRVLMDFMATNEAG